VINSIKSVDFKRFDLSILKNDLKKGLNIHVSYLFKFSRFKLHREVFLKLHDELIFSRFKFAFLEVHDEVLRRENQFSRFRVFGP
jgi:hypothetical protein